MKRVLVFVALLGCAREPAPAAPRPSPKTETADAHPVEESDAGSVVTPASTEAEPAKGPEPSVTFSSAGSIDRFLVLGRWKWRLCLKEQLKSVPSVDGVVRLELRIATDGKVMSSTVLGTTVPEALAECTANGVRTFYFPDGSEGTYTFTVAYTLAK